MESISKFTIPIEGVHLWDKNPREISDRDFQSLKNKIKRWGIWKPFLVWESKKQILGGNQRYKACKELGHKEIWVEYREPKDEAEALEMAIADNESSGEWIKSLLIEQIQLHQDTINLEDYKINIKDTTLKDLMPIDVEEDNPPEEEDINTVSVLGDLYELNEHRVLCGDSTMIDQVEKLMNGKKADMVFTDPPYGMDAVKNSGVLKERYKDIIGDDNTTTAIDAFNICEGIEKKIFWGANYYNSILPSSGCWIVWDKNNGGSDQADAELAWTNFPGVVRKFTLASEKTDRVHPTQKPIGLCSWVFNRWGDKDKMVLDLFLGSGSTLIACEKTERICYGMELDPHYCDVIVARYIKFMNDQQKPFIIKRNGEVINPDIFIKDAGR